jgi:hypothetical protein
MRKHLATLLLAVVIGVLGFAMSGVAVAGVDDKPPSPPGQGECEHGNSAKPCRDDPQPDKGKDCEVHGNNGGVNEDHCKGDETTPTETTPTDTPTTETTPTDSTPTETTPNDPTQQVTVPPSGESNASPPSSSSSEPGSTRATESPTAPTIVGTPPVAAAAKKQPAVLGVTADEPKPTRQAQQAPLTL